MTGTCGRCALRRSRTTMSSAWKLHVRQTEFAAASRTRSLTMDSASLLSILSMYSAVGMLLAFLRMGSKSQRARVDQNPRYEFIAGDFVRTAGDIKDRSLGAFLLKLAPDLGVESFRTGENHKTSR